MPEKQTIERVEAAKRQGMSASTQSGEFVREEIHHIREGKHGARSIKQAIAIGLSKARRAGVHLPPPRKGTVSEKTRRGAERAYQTGRRKNPRHRRAERRRENRRSSASHAALHRGGNWPDRLAPPRGAARALRVRRRPEKRRAPKDAEEGLPPAKKAARTRQRRG